MKRFTQCLLFSCAVLFLLSSTAFAKAMHIDISVTDPTSEAVVARIEPGKNTSIENPMPFVHCNLDKNCHIKAHFETEGFLFVELLDKYGNVVQSSHIQFTDESISETYGLIYMEFAPQVFNKYPRR